MHVSGCRRERNKVNRITPDLNMVLMRTGAGPLLFAVPPDLLAVVL